RRRRSTSPRARTARPTASSVRSPPTDRSRARPNRGPGPPDLPLRAGLHSARSALLAQLVEHLHGKEGVDGSSPSEGSAKAPHVGTFPFRPSCRVSSVRWVWSRLWSFASARGTAARDQCPL